MLIVLIGKSGSGKDTLKESLIETIECEPIISTTTREPRPDEKDGVDYHFVSAEEFEKKITTHMIFEHRIYESINGKVYYGSEYRTLDSNKNYIKVLDVDGARRYIEEYGRDKCFVVEVSASDTIRYDRAYDRAFSSQKDLNEAEDNEIAHFVYEWQKRLADDNKRFNSENTKDIVNYTIINDNITIAETAEKVITALSVYEVKMKEYSETAHLHTKIVFPQIMVKENEIDNNFYAFNINESKNGFDVPATHIENFESLEYH